MRRDLRFTRWTEGGKGVMKPSETVPPHTSAGDEPSSMRPAGLHLGWKLPILAMPVVLLGAAVWHCGQVMRPFKDGNSADFWYAACGVQVDPGRRSYCVGPVYPSREGWLVYQGHDERYIAIHGAEPYRVPEGPALALFPEVVRQLEERAHLKGTNNPRRGAVIDAGYRAWVAADPGRKDARGLLACIHDAWSHHWRELDRSRELEPPATMAAAAVAAWVPSGGQPWFALVTATEAEDRLRVFNPSSSPYSSYRDNLDRDNDIDRWWELAKYWRWNAAGEFCYLSALLLLASWPWLRNASPWRWGLHVGLLPTLLFSPHWLGYAYWSDLQHGPSGGVLYPSLIACCPRLPGAPLNDWVWDRFPLLLYSWSYPVDSNTGWFQADLKAAWLRTNGDGPVTVLTLSAVLGMMTYRLRRAILMSAGRSARVCPAGQKGAEG